MSAVRFLLDENVAPLYRRELLRRDPALIVWKVGDVSAPPGGMLDPFGSGRIPGHDDLPARAVGRNHFSPFVSSAIKKTCPASTVQHAVAQA
jgi:hypothetical protein